MNRKRVFGFLLFLGLWALFSPAQWGPHPVSGEWKIVGSAAAATITLPPPTFTEGVRSNPRFEEIKKSQERFSSYLYDRLKPIDEFLGMHMTTRDEGEPYFWVTITHARLIVTKDLPDEFEGIAVHYAPLSSEPDPDHPISHYEERRQICSRFEDFICGHPKLKKLVITSQGHIRFDKRGHGALILLVGVTPGKLKEAKKHLPPAFEGVPIEIDIDDSWPNTLCARKASDAEWGAKVEQARIIFGRFADAICECEEVRRHIITSEIDGDMHDLVFLVKMRPGWLEKAKELLPAEYEGIRVKFMELGSHYTKALSWCTRNLRAWMQDGNPRFEKIKKIHERFSAYLHAGLKPLEQLVSLETKADEQGEPYFEVAINDKRWEVVKEKNLPHEVEGIPVKYVPSASQPSTDYPQTPCSWMRDDNPRFQEIQKIKVRFSAHVRTHLEPVKEFISMGTGCDDQGEPYFEVGINHERMEVIREKDLPDEWEGIPVKYVPEMEMKFFRE